MKALGTPRSFLCVFLLAAACAEPSDALPAASGLDGSRVYALVRDGSGGADLVDVDEPGVSVWRSRYTLEGRTLRIGTDGQLYAFDHRSLVRFEPGAEGDHEEVEVLEFNPSESWADAYPLGDDVLLVDRRDGALVSASHGALGRSCAGPPQILTASSTASVFCAGELLLEPGRSLAALRRRVEGYLGLAVEAGTAAFSVVTMSGDTLDSEASVGSVDELNLEPLGLALAPNQRAVVAGDGTAYVMTVLGAGLTQYPPRAVDTTIYRLEEGRVPERIFAAKEGLSGWLGAPIQLLTGP